MNKTELLNFLRQGHLPGPDEDEATFQSRIKNFQNASHADEDLKPLKEIFGLEPTWLRVEETKKGLMPWEGGAIWVDKKTKESVIRIHPKPKWGYSREEILSHEAVHAMRIAYQEPYFEEILAYQTSKKPFRRLLGPLFVRPIETWLFLLVLLFGIVIDWTFPLLIFGYLAMRLYWRQKQFSVCLKHFSLLSDENPRLLALLCTDKELKLFSRSTLDSIRHYLIANRNKSLRLVCLNNLIHF